MKHEQTNIFVGMNKDTDIQYLKEGEYLDAENVRLGSSVSNNVGTVETLYGSLGLSMPTAPTGTDKIVGRCKDIQYGLIYIFVYNANGNHRILKLDTNNDTISILLKSSQLFQLNSDPTFVSTTIYDKQLFWCNGTNFDKSSTLRHLDLNLDWSTVDYADDIEDLISNIKRPSLLPITTTLSYDSGINLNKLNDQSYQFCYRFVLKNNQQTRFSPISQLAVSGYDITDKPNKIALTIPTFGADNTILTKVIKYIEVAFRGKYTEDFKSFKKIDFPSTDIPVTENFYNNEAYSTVTPSDYITEYDNSPLFASSVQYADTRVFWANYQQERFKQPISVEAGIGADSFGNITYTPVVNQQVLKPTSTYKYSIELIDKYGRRTTAMVDGTNMGTVGSITTATQVGLVTTLQKKKLTINLSGIADDYKDYGAVQIRRSQNLDYSRFIQGRVEHAYYKMGTDVNGDPTFVKPIDWTTQNYSTFNYVINFNNSDAGANELYFDISNWKRSNIDYTFAQGDRIRILTTGSSSTQCAYNAGSNQPESRIDYPIIRQEGDLLVVPYVNSTTVYCVDAEEQNSNTGYGDYATCGSFGYMTFYNENQQVTKIVDSTYTGWKDAYRETTFFSCSLGQTVGTDDKIIYYAGENGTILKIDFYTKTITDLSQGTQTYRKIEYCIYNRVSSTIEFVLISGDKDSNGYGTILVYDLSTNTMISKPTLIQDDVIDIKYLDQQRVSNTATRLYFVFICRNVNTQFYYSYLTYNNLSTNNGISIKPLTKVDNSQKDYGCNLFTKIDYRLTFFSGADNRNRIAIGMTGNYFAYSSTNNGLSAQTFLEGTGANELKFYTDKFDDNLAYDVTDIKVPLYADGSANTFYIIATSISSKVYYFMKTDGSPITKRTVTFNTDSEYKSISAWYNNGGNVGRYVYAIVGGTNKLTANVNFDLTTNQTLVIIGTESQNQYINYGAMIEVYTPASPLSEQIYYEIGNCHLVSEYEGDDYIYETTLNDGDCFYIAKQFYGRLWSVPRDNIISMSPTKDTWSFWHKDIGRPNLEDLTVDYATTEEQELIPFRTFTSNIIFSNPYIQGTKTNGLCSFELLNYKQLPIEYGGITAIQVANNTNEDGTIMLSVHKHEIVSIYIGKVQYTDVAGNNVISLSDQVLGSFRTTNGSLGSVNPESVAQYNSAVYGFDAIKGVVWRYGQNGVTRLSDIGMRNFFYNEGKYYLQNLNYDNRLIGEYNNFFDEYCLTLPSSNKTMIWSERYNKWICSRNYTSELGEDLKFQASLYNKNYIGLNLQVEEGVYNASIFKTDVDGQEVGVLVNVYRNPSITLVANKDPNLVKNWNNIRLQTNQCWDMICTTENGQSTSMNGQQNEILDTLGDSEQLENNFYAPILNNESNGGNRFDGEPLKSQTLTIKATLNKELIDLKEQENNIIKIYNVSTYSSISFR